MAYCLPIPCTSFFFFRFWWTVVYFQRYGSATCILCSFFLLCNGLHHDRFPTPAHQERPLLPNARGMPRWGEHCICLGQLYSSFFSSAPPISPWSSSIVEFLEQEVQFGAQTRSLSRNTGFPWEKSKMSINDGPTCHSPIFSLFSLLSSQLSPFTWSLLSRHPIRCRGGIKDLELVVIR